MKNRFLFLLMLVFPFVLSAQRNYFIYIQSDPQQAFYVRSGNVVHSSSASGYLILSQLKDSVYTFSIGFPGNKFPAADYAVTVGRKDQGYLFKNFGEKGWGLFNLQTLAVLMPVDKTISNPTAQLQSGPVSSFTDLLSKAADDSTLRMQPVVVKKEEPKPPVPVVLPVDTLKAVVQSQAVPEKKEEIKTGVPVNPQPEKREEIPPVITPEVDTAKVIVKTEPVPAPQTEVPAKAIQVTDTTAATSPVAAQTALPMVTSEKSKSGVISLAYTTEANDTRYFVYIEKFEDGSADTVIVELPVVKTVVKTETPPAPEEKKFLEISSDPAKDTLKTEPPVTEPVKAATASPCKSIAKEDDFVKLRRKMVSRSNDDDMIMEAKKYFKSKCFTTDQIRNLSTIFLSDAGKYNFFDAAYPYTADRENFPLLQSELKSDYQVNRFKAMLQ